MRQKGIDGGLHVEMEHPIGQGRAHVVTDRTVEARISRGHHLPAVRQPIVTDSTIEDQRVGRDLQSLIRGGELVEKEDAVRLVGRGQELGREPDRLGQGVVGIDGAADVDRLDRGQAQIHQGHPEVVGDLTHDRGLAHAARAPEHGCASAQNRIGILLDQRGLGRGNRDGRDVHRVAEHLDC